MKIMVYRDRKYTTMYDYLLKPVLLVPIFWPPSKVQSGWVKSCSLPWSGLKQSPLEAGPARAANLGSPRNDRIMPAVCRGDHREHQHILQQGSGDVSA